MEARALDCLPPRPKQDPLLGNRSIGWKSKRGLVIAPDREFAILRAISLPLPSALT